MYGDPPIPVFKENLKRENAPNWQQAEGDALPPKKEKWSAKTGRLRGVTFGIGHGCP
jgi:hypothetical protein